jgi:hypothetical protein
MASSGRGHQAHRAEGTHLKCWLKRTDFRSKIGAKITGKNLGPFAPYFPCYRVQVSLLSQKFFPVIFPGHDHAIANKPLNTFGFQARTGRLIQSEQKSSLYFSLLIVAGARASFARKKRPRGPPAANYTPANPARTRGLRRRRRDRGERCLKFPDIGVARVSGGYPYVRSCRATRNFCAVALTVEDEWNWVVQSGGLEPPTSGSTIRRSNQLSYDCQWRRKLGMPAFKSKQRVPLPQTNSAAKTGAQGRPNHS